MHYARHGQIPLLEPNAGLAAALADPSAQPKYSDILAFSSYADSLGRYLKMFPRTQLHVADYRRFVDSPAGLEAIYAFLGVPVPENAWPFPVINRGSYDWAAVERSHAQSRARNIYDELANIIGSRPDAISPPVDERPSVEVSITDDTRAALRARYADEGRRLVELGIFDHQPWLAAAN